MARNERRWAGSRSTPPSWRAPAVIARDRSRMRIGLRRGAIGDRAARGEHARHARPPRPPALRRPVELRLRRRRPRHRRGRCAPAARAALHPRLPRRRAAGAAFRRWRGAPLGRLATVGVLLQVVQFGGVYGGFALGVPAALSALAMLGLSPLVTTGLAVGSGQERADARLWIGLSVGLVGVAISLAPELGSAAAGAGLALTVLAMLGLAGGTVLQKRWGGSTDPMVSAAAQNLTAAVLVAPVAVVAGGRLDVSAQLVLCLGWIVLGLAVGTLLIYVHLLRRHAASTVTALLLLVPPVTAGASALTLGEALHPAS